MSDHSAGELVYSAALGREIRSAPAEKLGTPTDVLLLEAVAGHDAAEALRLLDYLVAEAGRVFEVLTSWLDGLMSYGRERVPRWDDRVAALQGVIGSPPPTTTLEVMTARESARVRRLVTAGDVEAVPEALRALRLVQWTVHDALTDWLWGLLTEMQDELGEDAMGEVLRVTVRGWFDARYAALPSLTPRESLELVIEGARGHFSGPDHSGNIEVAEDDEKWVMAFDPCGSGGRMRRGDEAMAQTSRTLAPYEFGFVAGSYDWTWQEEGVCLYCAHCSFANEILSIERQGTPMRVTKYPAKLGDKCTWTIYKDPAEVPPAAYHRVGKQPPVVADPV